MDDEWGYPYFRKLPHIYIYYHKYKHHGISLDLPMNMGHQPSAVAEVSQVGNLQERLVVVKHGWQSEATDGWIYLSIYLSTLVS